MNNRMNRMNNTERNGTLSRLFLMINLALFLSFQSVTLLAQQATFSVNMEHSYIQAGDKVVVRGNISQLGEWEADGQLILRKKRNSNVYEGQLDLSSASTSSVLFKYVILRAGGNEEWEERGNRELNLNNTGTVWFNDRQTPGTQQTVVNVTITLDLSEHLMDGYPVEEVAIMGSRAPLSFDLENGRTAMKEIENGIWETTLAFPYGTQHDVAFKFVWKHDNEWMWEWRPGHTNHVFLIDDSGDQQHIALKYDPLVIGVIPVNSGFDSVDNYEAVLASLPEANRVTSRYMYEKAIQELGNGEINKATNTYAQYKSGHQGGEEIDDFHYRMIHHIERTAGLNQARTYLENRLAEETDSDRIEYYNYLKGELALNNGNIALARRQFKQLKKSAKWDLVLQYADEAMIHSYIKESNPDSVLIGIAMLQEKVQTVPINQQRAYLKQLARAYQSAEMNEERIEVLRELAMNGTPKQRFASAIDLVNQYRKIGLNKEALRILERMDKRVSDRSPRKQAQVMRLHIQTLYELDEYEQLAVLLNEYEIKWEGDSHSKRFAKYKEKVVQKLGPDWKPKNIDKEGLTTIPADSTQN